MSTLTLLPTQTLELPSFSSTLLLQRSVRHGPESSSPLKIHHYSKSVTYITSCERRCLYVDPQIVQFGMDASEVMQHPDWRFDRVHPDDRLLLEHHLHNLQEADHLCIAEYRLQTSPGHYVMVLDEARRILDQDQRPLYYAGVLLNIQDRLHLEYENHRLRHHFDQAVQDGIAVLTRCNELLQACNQQLSEQLRIALKKQSTP